MKSFFLFYFLFILNITISAQWTKLSEFTTEDLTSCDFINAEYGIVVGNNGSVYKTIDGEANWVNISPDNSLSYTSVVVRSVDTFYLAGYRKTEENSSSYLFSSYDGGKHWSVIYENQDYVGFAIVKYIKDKIYYLESFNKLISSSDNGNNWKNIWTIYGTTVLNSWKLNRPSTDNLFIFGNASGFLSYSTQFIHAINGGNWYGCFPFDFGSLATFNAYEPINGNILLFQSNNTDHLPNDTSSTLIMLYNFYKDEYYPPRPTGDTVWHFNSKIINNSIDHYVVDCYFSTNYKDGYTIDTKGNIFKTSTGGNSWNKVYSGSDLLSSIFMISDTVGYIIGNHGTVLKLGSTHTNSNKKDISENIFKLYPSIADNYIYVEFYDKKISGYLTIYNAAGEKHFTQCINNNNFLKIDISHLQSGIYYIICSTDRKSEILKFIKL